jgi:hypothetical protein
MPFPLGQPLGFTLGQWLAATGHGTYEALDQHTALLDLQFEHLIPNGVYTVWCARVRFPPHFRLVDEPAGAPDGSENVFRADADGRASFRLKMHPLADSSDAVVSTISIAYHSDGKTHGRKAGVFGVNVHSQIGFIVPPPRSAGATTDG